MGCSKSKNNKIIIQNDNYQTNHYWNSNDDCCICLDKKANILLLPCNHLIVCGQCCKANILRNYNVCPLCQGEVYSYNLLEIIPAIPS